MIQITNYQFDKYNITYNINLNEKTGIYFVDKDKLSPFLLKISGINKADKIYFHSRIVFDNKDYFKNRLYLDCNKPILNTLKGDKISKSLQETYNFTINSKLFDDLVKKLDIRMEGSLEDSYKFSPEGIALCNISLALSSFKTNILLNPLENIISKDRLSIIKEEYKDKGLVAGVTDLSKYTNLLEKIMFFNENKLFIFNSNEKLLVLDNIASQKLLIEASHIENLIVYQSYNTERLIILDDIDREQNKVFNEYKVKINPISIFNIGEYLC